MRAQYYTGLPKNPSRRLHVGIMVERLVEYTEQQRLQLTTHTTYQPELGTIHPAFALQHVIDELMHASQLM